MMMNNPNIQQHSAMDENISNLTCTSDEPIASSAQSFASSHQAQTTAVKRKRNLPGNPDPDAEVIALSPKTLMATNRFLCEICNKGFQRDQNLQLHRRGHNLPWKLKQRTSKEVKKKVYVCPEVTCVHHDPSRALGDLTGIKKHFSRKHGEKKWKCDKCSKKYAVQSDWKAHSKTCGTREYKCDCGTLFSRRDSFITHRAFCDALAEESARAITANPPQHIINLQPQFNIHGFQPNPVKIEQQQLQHQYDRQEHAPQWFENVFHENISPAPSFPHYQSTSSPHMSATALLQKAAQMGATTSKPTMLSRPQQSHMSGNSGNHTTNTASGYGLGLSSREGMESGFMHSLTAFETKSTASPVSGLMGHLSATSLLQEMSSISSESGFDGSSYEDAFGGMLNSKKQTTVQGGGGNDGLTKDFLSLRTFPHRDFVTMAGIDQCMSSSIPYEQQNQNEKPWQG